MSWSLTVGALCLAEQLGGVSWRTNPADESGGPVWRTSLADLVGGVGLWRYGCEPRLIGTLRCEDRQVPEGVSWSLTVGALWLALSDWRRKPGGVSWRSNLAVSVGGATWRCQLADLFGGPRWRCRLWRCGIEPRLISTLRCEDRQVPGGVSCSVTVRALWLALSDRRRNLAVSVGGPRWRTSLVVSPVAVQVRAAR